MAKKIKNYKANFIITKDNKLIEGTKQIDNNYLLYGAKLKSYEVLGEKIEDEKIFFQDEKSSDGYLLSEEINIERIENEPDTDFWFKLIFEYDFKENTYALKIQNAHELIFENENNLKIEIELSFIEK